MLDPTTGFANDVLERESWARQRLAQHSGQTFVVVATPIIAPYRIDATGLLEPYALADGPADLRLTVQPWSVPGLLADPSRWDSVVRSEGDPALASTLRELAQTAPLWIEQFLGRWLGPIAGQRLADTARHTLALPQQVVERLSSSVASYLSDQMSLVARGDEARAFADEVTRVAQRTVDLEVRLEGIASRLKPGIG
ncbi:MAG: hypothetical protein M3Z31_02420 [Pseudomonadota bacterium]|nr:hypothetical protein [Pseudomonadota bacterium]